ncbi:MAG: hypothetical protein HAW59_04850, partial [Betaproteobacteria bacterium]|nr:hypothetical protein [Betaproteobacteria bacterium]
MYLTAKNAKKPGRCFFVQNTRGNGAARPPAPMSSVFMPRVAAEIYLTASHTKPLYTGLL